MLNGAIAVITAYLLGSIPTALIITRWLTKEDIRRLGSGNVGAHNVFLHVGKAAGIAVGIFDVAKGAIAVILASQLFHTPLGFMLGAGMAVVLGHMWSVFLRFNGGNGLATALGIFAVLIPLELLIAFALTAVFFVLTRNFILSINVSLLSLPVSAWLLVEPDFRVLLLGFTMVLLLVMALHFWPVAKADFHKAGNWGQFLAQLLRQEASPKNTR